MSFLKKIFGNEPEQTDSVACNSEQELMEYYGGITLEKQQHFSNIVGDLSWNVDIQAGEITFGNRLIFPFQILGTFSHSSETWLWAWANEQSGIPGSLMEQALALRRYGQDNGIDLLRVDQFDATQKDLHLIGIIASGMFGSSGYYLADYGQGTMCITIKSGQIDKSFENSHHAVLTIFPQLISIFEMNHKNALMNYLQAKGYDVNVDESGLEGSKNGKVVKAVFDELSRLTKLDG